MAEPRNVLGDKLEICCTAPMTGFYRTGTCETEPLDMGTHVICGQVTDELLAFTRSKGDDLVTSAPEHGFPGLNLGPLVRVRHPVAGGLRGGSGPADDSDDNPRGRPQVRFFGRPEESRH